MENVFTKALGGHLSTAGCISSSPMDMSNLQSSPKLGQPLLQIVVFSLELCHKRCGRPKTNAPPTPQQRGTLRFCHATHCLSDSTFFSKPKLSLVS